MLHLNSATSTAIAKPSATKFLKCSQCGAMKRRSTLSSSSKNAAANAGADGGSHHNFCLQHSTKQLTPPNATTPFNITPSPPSSSNAKQHHQFLQRSNSEPIYFEEIQNGESSKKQEMSPFAATREYLNPLSPETSKTGTNSSSPSPAMASLPPLPPPLRRTMSEPTAADPQGPLVAATASPPPQPSRSTKRSPVSDDSPNSKRLKRMKERMKEMSEWWGQVVHEETADFSSEDDDPSVNPKDESENEHEEAVWVEKHGEGLVIHFKCPCGKGYGIFLYGNNCYYKLM